MEAVTSFNSIFFSLRYHSRVRASIPRYKNNPHICELFFGLRALHSFLTAIWQIPGNISPFKIVNYW